MSRPVLSGVIALCGVTLLALSGCAGGSSAPAATKTDAGATSAPVVAPPTVMTAGELTLCVDSQTPPNIYFNDKKERVGIEVDIANRLASVMHLKPVYEEYDFAGLIPAIQARQCDAIFSSLYIKPAREEILNFVPYLMSGTGVAVSKANPQHITGLNDTMCGTNILTISGATGALQTQDQSKKCVAKNLKPIQITYVSHIAPALQQLTSGQVAAYVDVAASMAYYQKTSNGAFKMVGQPFGQIQIGAGTLKNNTKLHEAMQAAFDTMQKDGSYTAILKKWNVVSEGISAGSNS